LATYLAPPALLDLEIEITDSIDPESDEIDETDETDEGVIVDGTGIARLGFRCWTEASSETGSGVFLVLHRAVVWDRRGVEIAARPSISREAALNEALSRYLATAEVPTAEPAFLYAALADERS
jgi:hypothetical protein